jgi:hypothetical protein
MPWNRITSVSEHLVLLVNQESRKYLLLVKGFGEYMHSVFQK